MCLIDAVSTHSSLFLSPLSLVIKQKLAITVRFGEMTFSPLCFHSAYPENDQIKASV